MRPTLIIVVVVLVLLGLYVASFHLLLARMGDSWTTITGTPGHLVHQVSANVVRSGSMRSPDLEIAIKRVYLPLAWCERALSARPLAPGDTGAQELQDMLTVDALCLEPTAAEGSHGIAVARIRAAAAAVVSAGAPAGTTARPPPHLIYAVLAPGRGWTLVLGSLYNPRIYTHDGTAVLIE